MQSDLGKISLDRNGNDLTAVYNGPVAFHLPEPGEAAGPRNGADIRAVVAFD